MRDGDDTQNLTPLGLCGANLLRCSKVGSPKIVADIPKVRIKSCARGKQVKEAKPFECHNDAGISYR